MNLQLLHENSTNKLDKTVIRSEIIRNLVNGTKMLRRSFDPDDYCRGSTSVGELGFFDLDTAIIIVETLVFNIGIEEKMLLPDEVDNEDDDTTIQNELQIP